MKHAEFEKEVLGSHLCPDDFQKKFAEFQQYQKLAWNTLVEFHGICIENQIHYQLAYGSLLGAIRDEGQIPWDYDIDVFVPYEERARLIEALQRSLKDEYYFESREINRKYSHVFTRVTPRGYDSEILHVDIFYTIAAPADQNMIRAFSEKVAKLSLAYFYKTVSVFTYGNENKKYVLKLILNKLKLLFVNADHIYQRYIDLCEENRHSGSPFCIAGDQYGINRYYESKTLWDLTQHPVKGVLIWIPKKYSDLLKKTYGNYHGVPSLEGRLNEFNRTYSLLKRQESK